MNQNIKVLAAGMVLLAGVLIVAGCIEEKSEYTINPDGSGKVVHEYILQPNSFNLTGEATGPESQLKENVRQTLEDSVGVDLWRDISYELTPEGNTKFKGTAYFKNIKKVSIKSGSVSTKMNLDFEIQPYGTIILELLKAECEEEPNAASPTLTDEQVAQMVAMAKTQHSQSRPELESFMGGLKTEMIFNLPGTIQAVSNFEKVDSNTVRLAIEGAKVLAVMDEVMSDDKLLAEQIRQGRNLLEDGPDEAMNEKLFGQKGSVRVIVSDAKPLFDYDSEAAAAKADYADILRELGLDLEISKPAVVEEEIDIAPAATVQDANVSAEPDYEKPIGAQLRDGFKREVGGDVDGALKIYLGIIANEKAEEKDLARTYHRIGVCYLKKSNEEKAIESFVHVATHFPQQRGPVLKAEKELKKLERSAPKKESSEEENVDFVGTEISNDAGIKEKGISFVVVDGYVAKFEALDVDKYLTAIRVYATRPSGKKLMTEEDLTVFLLDDEFQIVNEFTFPLKKFEAGVPKWVTLEIEPIGIPSKFAICLDGKGVLAVGADAENSGQSFFGLPGKDIYLCNGNGDWLIRAVVNDIVVNDTVEE